MLLNVQFEVIGLFNFSSVFFFKLLSVSRQLSCKLLLNYSHELCLKNQLIFITWFNLENPDKYGCKYLQGLAKKNGFLFSSQAALREVWESKNVIFIKAGRQSSNRTHVVTNFKKRMYRCQDFVAHDHNKLIFLYTVKTRKGEVNAKRCNLIKRLIDQIITPFSTNKEQLLKIAVLFGAPKFMRVFYAVAFLNHGILEI